MEYNGASGTIAYSAFNSGKLQHHYRKECAL